MKKWRSSHPPQPSFQNLKYTSMQMHVRGSQRSQYELVYNDWYLDNTFFRSSTQCSSAQGGMSITSPATTRPGRKAVLRSFMTGPSGGEQACSQQGEETRLGRPLPKQAEPQIKEKQERGCGCLLLDQDSEISPHTKNKKKDSVGFPLPQANRCHDPLIHPACNKRGDPKLERGG